MKYILDKRNYIIFAIIIILMIWIFSNNNKIFVKSFDLNNKILTVIIYEKIDENKVTDKIKSICNKYGVKKNYLNSYAVEKIIKYFKKSNIKKYLINEDGNISAGKRYKKDKYAVSILNPKNGDILKIIYLENESMATVKNDTKTVSVIHKDNVKASKIAKKIFNLELEEGREICENLDCEAFLYDKKNTYETSGIKSE